MKKKSLTRFYNLKKYSDNRGWLSENITPRIMKNVRHFFISNSKGGVIRGNHYHNHKREWFLILEGKAKVYLYDLKTKKRESFTIRAEDERLFEMKPKVVHAIKNIGNKNMLLLALINEVLNHKNPDTYPYILIKK